MQILMDIGIIAVAILLIYVGVKILAAPIRGIVKFLLHAGLGILVLILVNIVSGFFNIYVPITWTSVVVSGLAGIPGIALLILLKLLF
ncbi:MAG: pro-sigmaK processing inhibitor BofA family protein [Oscillospiraceae bacterium]|nr:pro-sigmaK processing inhibitor BofA family protein [Oscillospiraceae bacterium]